MTKLRHKRGDTFSRRCIWKVNGAAVDLTGSTIACQLRDGSDTLVATLTATPDADQSTNKGYFDLTFSEATTGWPLALLDADIERTNGSEIRSSETFNVEILKDITHP